MDKFNTAMKEVTTFLNEVCPPNRVKRAQHMSAQKNADGSLKVEQFKRYAPVLIEPHYAKDDPWSAANGYWKRID